MAAGIGRHQLDVNRWCLEMGGHCRTGLEDNVRWDKGRLAASNAELVTRVADLCAEYNRRRHASRRARHYWIELRRSGRGDGCVAFSV